jgi:membrane protein implicated in regulation of membrane protease activity
MHEAPGRSGQSFRSRRRHERHTGFGPFRTYVLASTAGWLIVGVLTLFAWRSFDVPAWTAVLVVGIWVCADLVRYPAWRRYYTAEPAERRMVGERGVAVSSVDAEGVVRVRGELWDAAVAEDRGAIPARATVRVRAIRGLKLFVERDSSPRADSAPEQDAFGT